MPARRSRQARCCRSSTRRRIPIRGRCSPAIPTARRRSPAFRARCRRRSRRRPAAASRRAARDVRAVCSAGTAAAGPVGHRRRSALRAIRMSAPPILAAARGLRAAGRQQGLSAQDGAAGAGGDGRSASTCGKARSCRWWANRAAARPRSGRTILGLQRESAGEILLDGRPVGGLPPEAARRARNGDPVRPPGCRRGARSRGGASAAPWKRG